MRCSCQVAVVWAGQGGSALVAAAVAERDRQRRLTGFLIDAPMFVKGFLSACRIVCGMAGRWGGQDREGPLTTEGRLL